MHALARALPDRINSLSGVARDLTATTAHLTHRELDRARELSSALRQRLEGLVDRDTRRSLTHLTRREIERARDLSGGFRRRFDDVVHPGRRSSRLPLAVSAVVVGVAIGGVLLTNPRVRASLRQGWDFVRVGRPAQQALRLRNAPDGAVWKPPQDRQEDLLDEGIEESFPASDPVSVKRIT